eukprot:3678325-Rhodomonas_salina.2
MKASAVEEISPVHLVRSAAQAATLTVLRRLVGDLSKVSVPGQDADILGLDGSLACKTNLISMLFTAAADSDSAAHRCGCRQTRRPGIEGPSSSPQAGSPCPTVCTLHTGCRAPVERIVSG